MKRNNLLRFIIVLIVVAWSFYEMYPLRSGDIIEHFANNAHPPARDAAYSNIVTKARSLRQTSPDRGFANLHEAVGTNDIAKYFPQFEARNEVHPTTHVLNRLQREVAGKIKLGLDLQGGTSFIIEMDTNMLVSVETVTNKLGVLENRTNTVAVEGALEQAVEVLRKRVDSLGVAEPLIQPAGQNQILIQLPGLSEAERQDARDRIQKVAFLEFRMVHEDSRGCLERGEIPTGYQVMTQVRTLKNGEKQVEKYVVRKKAELTGSIKSAGITRDDYGRPEIAFRLDARGSEIFARVTTENVGHFLAIVLDGELQTAPRIKVPIVDGSGVITGDYSEKEAFGLANVLENPLKAKVNILFQRDVDPTLGVDSIKSGITASIIGVILVAGFMLVYYMLSGLVANVALITNIIILLGVMCSIGTTFTLPGIAGIVLTVGMAVDANVLIYERIREELAKGKSLRGAIAAGYDRAFSTIFDSHVTTLISSVILIYMGTGSVKGFGVALTIGVAASLFTALVVTRLIFDFLLEKNLIKSLPMLHLIRNTKINFMRLAVPAFVASWLLILIGIGYGVFYRGSDVMGVEFAGGNEITLGFDQSKDIGVDKIRHAVEQTGFKGALISYQREIGNGQRTLTVTVRDLGDQKTEAKSEEVTKKVVSQLKTAFPEADFTVKSTLGVGPSVGAELRNTAILAALLAMFGILIYVAFRYEFSFAVGAVIAIIHDILMTLGWYFLVDRELNATTVAAILTIIGFSINDTIVIFDRIREDLKLGVRGTFTEVINQALNQTLSRTLITSGTVFLATLSLYIFGGGPVNDFAFTFLVGILTGTYSSIYIASVCVLLWQKWFHGGQRPNIGSGQLNVPTAGTATAKP
ncbi:MAG: protein translocase subunit SecD [Pedosphaera sp.]|nr:protein translocase subunit SecD [Pedosphaera sp.]